ncbi:MAG: hypothetical protein AB8I08_04970 [Sandaracinaceae bacterium]
MSAQADAECVRCHAPTTASFGAHAWTDPIVVAERGDDTTGWCGSCHRPSGPSTGGQPANAPSTNEPSSGVGCVDCHVDQGVVLSPRSPTASGLAAHAMRAAEWDGVRECAGCHEFRFPGANDTRNVVFDPEGWLQRTASEWRSSPARQRGETCVSCHMPDGGHAMRAAEGQLEVSARARSTDGGANALVTLTARGMGHAFPTGDMYRALEVRVWAPGAPERAVTQRLTRHFARGADRLRREVLDTRLVPGEPRRVLLRVSGSNLSELRWSVSLLRLPPERAARMRVEAPPRPLREGTVRVAPPRRR